MGNEEILAARHRLTELKAEMVALGPVMRGSVTLMGTRTKQFYCSLNKGGKTRLIFLGKGREPIARRYSENHKRLLEIVDEMTILHMELLKANAVDPENS
jgi:hypothetical protein